MRLAIRTTRIFRRDTDRKWRQVHHHGSIDDPQMLAAYQEAVLGSANYKSSHAPKFHKTSKVKRILASIDANYGVQDVLSSRMLPHANVAAFICGGQMGKSYSSSHEHPFHPARRSLRGRA